MSTVLDPDELSPQERAHLQRLGAREKEWKAAAAALQFGPPDPEMAPYHLLEFIRTRHPWYLVGWFQRELCAALDRFSRAVAEGRSPRLLIAAPPRHGKSQIVSRDFPVWHLARNPRHEVVVASYGQDFTNDLSRDARQVRDAAVEDWPHLAPGDRDGVENWRIAGGGSYFAVGVGGPLTGRGCNVLILDDPLKNWEEASSKLIREARWNWYASTAYTRLMPGGGVLAMATRWHESDPSGRMLKQIEDGEEKWEVLSYPAIAEADEAFRKEGEPLHPERYSREALEQIKRVLPARMWAALYQQRPTPDTGGMFQREWLARRYSHDPQRPPVPYTEILISCDATFQDAATSDFVSMVVLGRNAAYTDFHVLDEVHQRLSYTATRTVLRDLHRKWRPGVVLIERAASGHALIDDLEGEFAGVVGFKPAEYGSKDTRAALATPLFESGCVAFPEAEWTGDFVEELAAYPAGTNDDRVDAVSQALIYWMKRRDAGKGGAALGRGLRGLVGRLGG